MTTKPGGGIRVSTHDERKKAISRVIVDAMKKAGGVDWTKDSPDIRAAQADMEDLWLEYLHSDKPVTPQALVGSRFHNAYKRWRDLQKIEV